MVMSLRFMFRRLPPASQGLYGVIATLGVVGGACADVYHHAAVAADHVVASEAGLEMMRRGGNAVDAAVAASFTLSVVRPYSCGIGGGGFMVIHMPPGDDGSPARTIVLNYRETAPAAVGPHYFVDLSSDAPRFGGHAIGVPGTVAGLLHALDEYGTLDRATVMAPAIRAAEDGVAADANFVAAATHLASMFDEHPQRRELAAGIWQRLCLHGESKIGDVIRQPEKARALRLIAEHGAEVFYHGKIGTAIVDTVRKHNGAMTMDDLASYRLATTEPLRGRFMNHTILAMPPPSSGGIALLQSLGIIERKLRTLPAPPNPNSPLLIHNVVESLKHAFADRAEHLADAAFVDVPVARLLDPAYLNELAGRVDVDRALPNRFDYGSVTPEETPSHNPGGGGTSHLSVIDANGMAVACTETINLIFGSLVYVPEFGIVLNNQMDDFTTAPGEPNHFGLQQSDRNLPAPGKRPLSSMSPTIVLDERDRAILICGASGGPRIISSTLQVMLNSMLFDMNAEAAVAAPRFHHQWMPEVFYLEPGLDRDDLRVGLAKRGHAIERMADIGVVQLIRVHPDGTITAAADPRKGGRAAGY